MLGGTCVRGDRSSRPVPSALRGAARKGGSPAASAGAISLPHALKAEPLNRKHRRARHARVGNSTLRDPKCDLPHAGASERRVRSLCPPHLVPAGSRRRRVGPEPSRILPTRPHHNVCASFEDFADAVGLQIGAIADTDFSFDDRYAVEPFAAALVRQFKKAETFAWQVESTMNAPQLVLHPGLRAGLWHGGRIDETDQPTLSRLWRVKGQSSANSWKHVIGRLGGPASLESSARETTAFLRARSIENAVDLLRIILAYCLGERGLRSTAAWASAVGLVAFHVHRREGLRTAM
jgi:hypothetical protein